MLYIIRKCVVPPIKKVLRKTSESYNNYLNWAIAIFMFLNINYVKDSLILPS